MRLIELIKVHEECYLHHPIVGCVKWHNSPVDGWVLVFANGPEQWQILVADETVLFDDNWVLTLTPEEEEERQDLVNRREECPSPEKWEEFHGDSL